MIRSAYLVRLALPLGAAALYFAAHSYSASENLKPYSVQMHLHGSMSEGSGSMRGANVQAKKLGLDVLWWTDHDWRIAYHTYADGFDFESDELTATRPVPADGSEMEVELSPHPGNAPVVEPVARMSGAQAAQGKRSLELAATASGKPLPQAASNTPDPNDDGEGRARGRRRPQAIGPYETFFYTIDASRRRMKRSLASDVTVEIAIWPDFAPSDKGAMAGVRIDLSQQPPDLEQGSLFYVLTGAGEAELRKLESPHRKFVRLPFQPRQWNRFTLRLTDDARRLDLGGKDNALVDASFGLLTSGARAHAFFDDYRITHKLKSEPLRDEARRMAAELEHEYGITNYVSQELSYQAHLNPFGLNVPMIDYGKHPNGLSPKETVDFVHANGGVCSVNHIFGTTRPPRGVDVDDPQSVRQFEDKRTHDLIDSRMYGADILEVGYPRRVLPMTSFLKVWDALSAAGIYVMADGVSDSHTSNGGWFNGNNFVTWIWAPSKSIPDLVDGLRRGACYFGDPAQYKGELRLSTSDGHQMGQVVVGHKASHQVAVSITGLPAGAKVRTVVSGKYGEDFTAAGSTFRRDVTLATAQTGFFRVEVYTAEGKPLVFSNPIYFRPDEPGGLSAYKRTSCR